MTCTDVCNIIRACGKSNVKSLKYKGLEIDLREDAEVYQDNIELFPRHNSTIKIASEPELSDNEISAPIMDPIEIDESLLITNPELWEETQSIEKVNA